jgi:hypothetical protein
MKWVCLYSRNDFPRNINLYYNLKQRINTLKGWRRNLRDPSCVSSQNRSLSIALKNQAKAPLSHLLKDRKLVLKYMRGNWNISEKAGLRSKKPKEEGKNIATKKKRNGNWTGLQRKSRIFLLFLGYCLKKRGEIINKKQIWEKELSGLF